MNYSRLALRKESRCVESSAAQFEGAAKSCSPSLWQQKLGISIPSASVLAAEPNGSRRAPRFRKVAIPRNAFSHRVRIRTPAYLNLSFTLASPQHPSTTGALPTQWPPLLITRLSLPGPTPPVSVALAHPPPHSRTHSTRPPASVAPRQRRNSTARRSG